MNGSRSCSSIQASRRNSRIGPATGKNRSMREWIDNEMTKADTHAKQEQAICHRAPKLAKRDHERRDKLDKVATVRARLYPK